MYTHPLHKDSSLESLYSLCEQKATVSLFRLCSLLYYILYTSNGASFLPMMLMGHFTFANNVNGVLRVHQHCSWSVTCWQLMLLGCWLVLMQFKHLGQRLWNGATCWQTVLVLCYGLTNSVDSGLRGLRKQATFRDATNGFLAK